MLFLVVTCPCPPISSPAYPTTKPIYSEKVTKLSNQKYVHEIGAQMIGNHLIIRVEKDKNKAKKLRDQWDPPCDCELVEIQRSSSKGTAKIVNGGDNNQILFRVPSRTRMGGKNDFNDKSQAIAYHIGSCKGGPSANDQCRTVTVYPQPGGPGSQEVHTDHLVEGEQDVFLLRIKKNGDSQEQKKKNIEVELRTPLPPVLPPLDEPKKLDELPKEEKSEETGKKDKKKDKKNKKGKKEKKKK